MQISAAFAVAYLILAIGLLHIAVPLARKVSMAAALLTWSLSVSVGLFGVGRLTKAMGYVQAEYSLLLGHAVLIVTLAVLLVRLFPRFRRLRASGRLHPPVPD